MKNRIYIIFLFLFLPRSMISAEVKDTIIWYQYDIRPLYIMEGHYKDQGFIDIFDAALRKNLPQYHHIVKWANLARIQLDIKEGKKVIGGALLLSAERSTYMEYSDVKYLSSSQMLITTREKEGLFRKHLNSNGEIELERVLRDTSLSLVVGLGRIFPKEIMAILEPFENKNNVIRRGSSHDFFLESYRMIQFDRADYVIGYVTEFIYSTATNSIDPEEIVSFPIAGLNPVVKAYCVAPKNEWGKKVITDINEAVAKVITDTSVTYSINNWLPQNEQERFKKIATEIWGN